MNRRLYKYAVDLFVEMLNQVQKRTKPYRCNDNDTNAWNIWVDYHKKNKIPVTEEYIRKFIIALKGLGFFDPKYIGR